MAAETAFRLQALSNEAERLKQVWHKNAGNTTLFKFYTYGVPPNGQQDVLGAVGVLSRRSKKKE